MNEQQNATTLYAQVLCKLIEGFVQVDRQVTPSNLFFPASTSGGIPIDVKIQIFQLIILAHFNF